MLAPPAPNRPTACCPTVGCHGLNPAVDAELVAGSTTDALLASVVQCLAPLFMANCGGDAHSARLAALETIASYGARSRAELVKIGQIIGFGMAALDCLRRSMAPDLPLSMTLRLHGSANALNRSAQHNARALDKGRHAVPGPDTAKNVAVGEAKSAFASDDIPASPTDAPNDTVSAPAAVKLAATGRPSTDRMWASAMATVATKLSDAPAGASPAEWRSDQVWAEVLRGTASTLCGNADTIKQGDSSAAGHSAAPPTSG